MNETLHSSLVWNATMCTYCVFVPRPLRGYKSYEDFRVCGREDHWTHFLPSQKLNRTICSHWHPTRGWLTSVTTNCTAADSGRPACCPDHPLVRVLRLVPKTHFAKKVDRVIHTGLFQVRSWGKVGTKSGGRCGDL